LLDVHRPQTTAVFGIVLFNAETVEAGHEIMTIDPAVKNKVFRAELLPYKMALFGPDMP
jgi:hypothetical protein